MMPASRCPRGYRQRSSECTAADAAIISDEDGRIIFVNRQAEELFGYRRRRARRASRRNPDSRGQRERHRSSCAKPSRKPRAPLLSGTRAARRRKDGENSAPRSRSTPVETDDGLLVASTIRRVDAGRRLRGLFPAAARNGAGRHDHRRRARQDRGRQLQAETMFGYARRDARPVDRDAAARAAARSVMSATAPSFMAEPALRPMGRGRSCSACARTAANFRSRSA